MITAYPAIRPNFRSSLSLFVFCFAPLLALTVQSFKTEKKHKMRNKKGGGPTGGNRPGKLKYSIKVLH